jgi:hypothetical protein
VVAMVDVEVVAVAFRTAAGLPAEPQLKYIRA